MQAKAIIGWREWVRLPQFGVHHIKAKVDSGARSAALHAFSVEPYTERGVLRVRFKLHPLKKRPELIKECDAEVVDRRVVSDSGGHRERRFVIVSEIVLGQFCWPAEITLTDRENMMFRMLLGRTTLEQHFLIDPMSSYLVGEHPRRRPGPRPNEETPQ